MSQGTVPTPPGSAGEVGGKPLEDRVADLERRLAEATEGKALKQGDEERSARIRAINSIISETEQRMRIRRRVAYLAVAIIIGASVLLWHDMHLMLNWWKGTASYMALPRELHLAMFLAPLVAIVSIVIVLLVGAFRGFKDADISSIAPSSLISEAVNKSMGGN